MLEAVEYNSVGFLFPLMDPIYYLCCGCPEGEPFTTIFTWYIDIVYRIVQKGKAPGWEKDH